MDALRIWSMIPFAGLSLIVHSLVLLIKFLGKTLGLGGQKIKPFFLRWGLKVSPRLSLGLLNYNSSWRQGFAFLIIVVFISLTLINNFFILKITVRNSSSIAFLAETFRSALAFAGQKNSEEISQSGISLTNAEVFSAQPPKPTQNVWLVAEYLPIDISLASNYHKQSGLN